tara:strand:- start:363 stop:740 length:378 start_codon:yes stop_codon:yes gene_type:complete
MAIAHALITFNDLNISAQIGDIVYYTNSAPQGGFIQGALANTIMLGSIIKIKNLANGTTAIKVEYDNSITSLPPFGGKPFYSFAKDKRANTSSMLGYYASVNFVNDSTSKVELFSVGSEVSESSK